MIRLAVPDNINYDSLTSFSPDLISRHKLQILKLNENQCFEYLVNNRVDAALLNPLTYGKGLVKADFRIIRGTVLASENYSQLASVYFKEHLDSIKSCSSPRPEDFITQIASILLSEKFEIVFDEILKSGKGDFKTDSLISWNFESPFLPTLDVSEEWFDLYEIQMPLAFWVCKSEEFPAEIELIINSLSEEITDDKFIIDSDNHLKDIEARQGKLIFKMSDEFLEALDHTLQLLYFHGFFTEVPGIKILGEEHTIEVEQSI